MRHWPCRRNLSEGNRGAVPPVNGVVEFVGTATWAATNPAPTALTVPVTACARADLCRTQGAIEGLIRRQILEQLRDSHAVFLQYRLRDSSVRVFLQRPGRPRPREAQSWARDPGFDVIEDEFRGHPQVDIVGGPVRAFTAELERQRSDIAAAAAEP
jgi:hypothetical protein